MEYCVTQHQFVPRPDYHSLVAYRADRPAVDVDLSDSTNQWGIAPSAVEALRTWQPRDVTEYLPDTPRLAEAIGRYVGVSPDTVVTGCGSDNVLDAAFRGLAEPGDAVAYPAPTFAMIPILCRVNALRSMPVPVTASGDIDPDALLATRARIIYLCTPNNPSGTSHTRRAIERIIEEAPGVVIIDEAYAEFADDVYTAVAPAYPHVLSTRTLSKSFGLAGLRVGYGVGARALVDEVLKSRGPYKVNSFAERAAVAALVHDREWMASLAAEVRVLRVRFADALRSLGFAPLPSNANFVCVPVRDARATAERLYTHGIAVRGFAGLPVIGDVLRIGLAPWPVLERVCRALREAAE
jgi:histidinol-phosphate aminotransferase